MSHVNHKSENTHSSPKMKFTAYLLAAALLAPGSILLGIAATTAFAASATAGILAITINDYTTDTSDRLTRAKPVTAKSAKSSESLPLAA